MGEDDQMRDEEEIEAVTPFAMTPKQLEIINSEICDELAQIGAAITGMKIQLANQREALRHAEAVLTYSPLMSTNRGGKGPSTTTRKALGLVRAALKAGKTDD